MELLNSKIMKNNKLVINDLEIIIENVKTNIELKIESEWEST